MHRCIIVIVRYQLLRESMIKETQIQYEFQICLIVSEDKKKKV